MVNLAYHKGYFCINTFIFCQEGYCSECEIYLNKASRTKKINRHEVANL